MILTRRQQATLHAKLALTRAGQCVAELWRAIKPFLPWTPKN